MATKLTRLTQKNSDTTAPSGRELYHLQFSLQAASPETFGYTLVYQLHAPTALSPGSNPPAPTGQEAGWALESVWTRWRRAWWHKVPLTLTYLTSVQLPVHTTLLVIYALFGSPPCWSGIFLKQKTGRTFYTSLNLKAHWFQADTIFVLVLNVTSLKWIVYFGRGAVRGWTQYSYTHY
jgi:hypothetical protein